MAWPEDVGILAIEIVFPSQYVDQTELERFDGASAGKYVVGLGQSRMGFCTDREDINSLCLTAVHRLVERHAVAFTAIGHLEVGTETILDKSKSVKSVLMQLFEPNGATDIEGVDTTNACYGGTAALFNAVSWVESSAWDGRLALVVCGDIAVYAEGPARPTGGAGAVAMLVGPDAPLVLDRGVRSSYMRHAYDFYKPDLHLEYPRVDGRLSVECYLGALDRCYRLYCEKAAKRFPNATHGLDGFDYTIFHTPYCKLVQKSFARLVLNDFLTSSNNNTYDGLEKFRDAKLEETYFDRDVEKAFMAASEELFERKTRPSLYIANLVGNMYTPSVYAGLVSLLVNTTAANLAGKKVGVFSYGSGLAATMYSLTLKPAGGKLDALVSSLADVKERLEARAKVAPEEFNAVLAAKSKTCHSAPFEPVGDVDGLFPLTYYLTRVDEKNRRFYARADGPC